MGFVSAIWLMLFLPWMAAVVWVFRGRLVRAGVPFLMLWPARVGRRLPRRNWERPPVGILILLAAALAGILGAAGPWVRSGENRLPVTVIVDRGASMSAGVGGVMTRFAYVAKGVGLTVGRAHVVVVPPENGGAIDDDDWVAGVERLSRTAMDTSGDVVKAERSALAHESGAVVVISDQAVEASPRVAEIGPEQIGATSRPANAGIREIQVASGQWPVDSEKREVMVTVVSNLPAHDSDLTVSSDRFSASQRVRVVQGEQNFFLTLNGIGDVVRAELPGADDWEANHLAWAARQGAWPRVEVRGELPAALRRMVDVYGTNRHASDDSAVAGVSADATMADAGLIWTAGTLPVVDGELHLGDSQLTGDVDWKEMLGDVQTTADLPAGAGWTAVVTRGARVLIAERDRPVRQVWAGFWSDDWARRAGFVIFCTRALDWVGGGGETFASRGPGQLPEGYAAVTVAPDAFGTVATTAGYWPGVYRRTGMGSAIAVNAGALPEARVAGNDDLERLAKLVKNDDGTQGRALAGSALLAGAAVLAALALVALAMGARIG